MAGGDRSTPTTRAPRRAHAEGVEAEVALEVHEVQPLYVAGLLHFVGT